MAKKTASKAAAAPSLEDLLAMLNDVVEKLNAVVGVTAATEADDDSEGDDEDEAVELDKATLSAVKKAVTALFKNDEATMEVAADADVDAITAALGEAVTAKDEDMDVDSIVVESKKGKGKAAPITLTISWAEDDEDGDEGDGDDDDEDEVELTPAMAKAIKAAVKKLNKDGEYEFTVPKDEAEDVEAALIAALTEADEDFDADSLTIETKKIKGDKENVTLSASIESDDDGDDDGDDDEEW